MLAIGVRPCHKPQSSVIIFFAQCMLYLVESRSSLGRNCAELRPKEPRVDPRNVDRLSVAGETR